MWVGRTMSMAMVQSSMHILILVLLHRTPQAGALDIRGSGQLNLRSPLAWLFHARPFWGAVRSMPPLPILIGTTTDLLAMSVSKSFRVFRGVQYNCRRG
ncbi:hypothetical protein CY34DRAFT_805950 [Suillus luteus UH-Slu-Lm8-n1]|uniref:Secreted protein n=1 Tax=Suillus luteus UH-Slu-Lm8-n1 TaxID=930992 RepID=A0A0D0BE36_9AGAM|nr:hypothetical protein CY34DRAFT_805950 [Suillus luteus UH-Slu-Lm8-n1]